MSAARADRIYKCAPKPAHPTCGMTYISMAFDHCMRPTGAGSESGHSRWRRGPTHPWRFLAFARAACVRKAACGQLRILGWYFVGPNVSRDRLTFVLGPLFACRRRCGLGLSLAHNLWGDLLYPPAPSLPSPRHLVRLRLGLLWARL
jgi:hypothetical protein